MDGKKCLFPFWCALIIKMLKAGDLDSQQSLLVYPARTDSRYTKKKLCAVLGTAQHGRSQHAATSKEKLINRCMATTAVLLNITAL